MGVHYIVTNLYTLFSMQVGHNVMDSLYVERSINLKRNLQAEKIENGHHKVIEAKELCLKSPDISNWQADRFQG